MFLAVMACDHPTETRADLQRYFGIDLDMVGDSVSAFQAASCLACVPAGSSLAARLNKQATWTNEAHLLHALLCAVAGKRIPYPWDERDNGLGNESMCIDEFMAWYHQDWKEVEEDWQIQ